MTQRSIITRGITTVACAAGLLLTGGIAQAAPPPTGSVQWEALSPVPSLNVEKYMGTWNQIAAIPQPFSLMCARDTQATYTLLDPANVRVENTCTTWMGSKNEIVGNARVNDTVTNAQLHVSFPGVPTQENPEGSTNYIVAYIADDYSWALVGDPFRTSGFILSRSSAVTLEKFREIRAVVESKGYNSSIILTSPTPGGATDIRPLSFI